MDARPATVAEQKALLHGTSVEDDRGKSSPRVPIDRRNGRLLRRSIDSFHAQPSVEGSIREVSPRISELTVRLASIHSQLLQCAQCKESTMTPASYPVSHGTADRQEDSSKHKSICTSQLLEVMNIMDSQVAKLHQVLRSLEPWSETETSVTPPSNTESASAATADAEVQDLQRQAACTTLLRALVEHARRQLTYEAAAMQTRPSITSQEARALQTHVPSTVTAAAAATVVAVTAAAAANATTSTTNPTAGSAGAQWSQEHDSDLKTVTNSDVAADYAGLCERVSVLLAVVQRVNSRLRVLHAADALPAAHGTCHKVTRGATLPIASGLTHALHRASAGSREMLDDDGGAAAALSPRTPSMLPETHAQAQHTSRGASLPYGPRIGRIRRTGVTERPPTARRLHRTLCSLLGIRTESKEADSRRQALACAMAFVLALLLFAAVATGVACAALFAGRRPEDRR